MSPAPNCRRTGPWQPWTTKGSLVIPRTSLLRLHENLRHLMSSDISRSLKGTIWGQLMTVERLYDEDFRRDDAWGFALKEGLYPYSDHMRRAFVWLHIDPLVDVLNLEELRELTAGHELILAHYRRREP